MKDGDVIDLKKRYEIICPYCGKTQYACISILHTWGIADGGHGTCLDCKRSMRLIFDYKAETMTAEKWEV